MKRQLFFIAAAATLILLGTSSRAQAWGAYHVGYTHVGYGGVQHYGHTSAAGPYGAYSGSHYSSYGAGGAYHAGSASAYHAGYGETYHYGATSSAGAYHYGSYGAGYGAGVYRRW